MEIAVPAAARPALGLSAQRRSALLLDVALESAQLASDLLKQARRELVLEEVDPRADDLTIAVARQRVFLAQRRLLSTRHVLGYDDDLACDCC